MHAVIVFGAVAVILVPCLCSLVFYGDLARQSSVADEKFVYAMRHRVFGYILLGLALAIPPTLALFVVPWLKPDAIHPAPPLLLLASRRLTYALYAVLILIFVFRINGLNESKKKLHYILGWSAVGIFVLLCLIGRELYLAIYQ